MAERGGRVYLVGAGPGAADLITLRGAECLRRADAVIYDYLANPELLGFARPGAELIFVGKRGGRRRPFDQTALHRMMIARARRGQHVVRLKGGDPFIFARGGEEAEALARARVAFEVVPGVTSATAVPAFAGIPLTHRRHGSFVTITTGHADPTKDAPGSVPWDELAAAARRGGALVVLLATARMRSTLARLRAGGLPAATPAAAIHWGTTASQRTVLATLGTLADRCARARLGAPAVLVVGGCAGLSAELRWVEKLPLFGRRIVITRARQGAAEFARELRWRGAEVIEFPVIETAPPASFATLDRALGRLDSFDWVIFTSATGVDAFIARMRELGRDLRELSRASICAIGPATADRVKSHALRVAAMPAEYRAEKIAAAIGARRVRGARILIPRAQVAREVLPQILRKLGAREVTVAPAYRTIRPAAPDARRIRALAASDAIDLVTFTSSSTVTNFRAMVGRAARGLKAAAIGPITAATARRAGFRVVIRPSRYTVAALIDAIARYYARGGRGRRPRASHQAGP
jgi:uroporphyrinogen III methyltransferase / synthase